MKICSMDEFIGSEDYFNCINYIENVVVKKSIEIVKKHSKYKIIDFNLTKPDLKYYITKYNVPFFDIPLTVFSENNNILYLDIEAFTFAMNCQLKTLFLRKLWNENLDDPFLFFIYNHYKQYQINEEFNDLEKNAIDIFNKSKNVYEFIKEFLYNEEYSIFKKEDIYNLFNEMIFNNILENHILTNDILQLDYDFKYFSDIEHGVVKSEFKRKYDFKEDIMNGMFYAKYFKKLLKLKSKFNFIPRDLPLQDCAKIIKGKYLYMYHNGKYIFNVQVLLFY